MSAVRVIAAEPQEVQLAKVEAEQVVAKTNIDRLELVIKQFEEAGVHSDLEMERANEILAVIAEGKGRVEDYWNPKVSAAHGLHKMLTTARGEFTKRFDALRERLERPMKSWRREQAEEAARRQREIDLAAETLRKAKEAEARQLMKQGEVAAAQELKQEARAIVAPVLATETVKLDGTRESRPWVVTVENPMALVQAVAMGKVSIEVIKEFNAGWLKRMATAMNDKQTFELSYPGVKAEQDYSFAVGRK